MNNKKIKKGKVEEMYRRKRNVLAKRLLAFAVSASLLASLNTSALIVNAEAASSGVISSSEIISNNQFTLSDDTLHIVSNSNKIDLQACSPEILKVNYKPNGEESEDTLVIDPDNTWDTGNIVSYDLDSDPVVIKTTKMIVKISREDLGISVYNASNGLLVKQTSLPENNSLTLTHNSGQNFYGIAAEGNTNASDTTLRNGTTKVSAGSQGHAGAPFAWTTSGYGILVDSDGGNINIADTSFTYSDISKVDTEYYVLVGSPTEVLEAEAKVSGTSPMFPKWAVGFTNTQWGWPEDQGTAEEQLKEVIDTYREKEIPIDNFCLDFDWKLWGTGDDYGEFNWNTKNFPSAASGELKAYMDARGLKLTGIMKPRLFLGTQEEKDMDENGWWNSRTGIITDYCAKKPVKQVDFSKEGLRNWWWNQSKEAFDKGIVGFWNDEVDLDNGFTNFDGLNMQRAMYEGQTAYTSEQRPWSLNRNYYAGAQRYAYGMWSGDIRSGFHTMKIQKDRLIAAVNLGQPKWGMDTGGFTETPNDENYGRWLQFSAFTPIFRVHGKDVTENGFKVRYPWAYGETVEAAAKEVMQLRYKLIPYIYKYDRQAYDTGIGLVKSLMMTYPNDPNTKEYTDAWMFGDYLLVSPVLDEGQTEKSIYLPKGTWVDYAKGTVYSGGQTISYPIDAVTLKDVPLFIKQGAIIPSQDYQNYVGEKKMTNIYVDAFPDSKPSSFEYYDDDGNSTSYNDGNYFKQNFELSRNDNWTGVKFVTDSKEGSYTPDVEYYIVKLHVKSTGLPTIDGKTPAKYNSLDDLKSASGEGYVLTTDLYGDAAYVKIAAGKNKTIEVPCKFAESAAETAKIYARSTETNAGLQYSLDGGKTWSIKENISKCDDKPGYLAGSFTYKLTSNTPVKVRIQDSTGYIPSANGIELPSDESDIFTIEKDGTICVGEPAMESTNLYFDEDADLDSVVVQYKDENNNWSEVNVLTPYLGTAGHFYYSLSYPTDIKSNVVRYSLNNGGTWLPAEEGQSIGSGNYQSNGLGALISGKPEWDNMVVIYYNCNNGFSAPNIHWRAEGGTWTAAPGVKMEKSEFDGYAKAILNIGKAANAEVCFNDGGTWDNNGGSNYIFGAGVDTFDGGKTISGYPNTTKVLAVSASIIGGTYDSTQNVVLTSSIKGADIYYTVDGSAPTTSSTKYTSAITISSTTTLNAIAVKDSEKSPVYTQKYVIKDPDQPIEDSKIYFEKPNNWGTSINAYIYNEETGSARTLAAWPGVKMTNEGNGLYSYTLKNWEGNACVIFNDGSNQVPGAKEPGFILENGSSMIYKDGSWYPYSTETEPSVSSSKDDCEFTTDSLSLTLSAKNYTNAYYKVDNDNEISYIDGTNITIGKNAVDGQKITVTLTATDGTKTANKTYVYTKIVKQNTESKVYFQKPSDWSTSVNAYIYNEETGSVKTLAAWPGVSMTNEGNGLYSYTLNNWETDAYVIFNDGSKQVPASGQKGYLLENGTTMKYENGNWAPYSVVKVPAVSSSIKDCEFADSLTLTLSAKNCTSATYTLDNGTPVIYKDGTQIIVGKDAVDGQKVTLTLTGTDGTASAKQTYTYTKKVQKGSQIFFRRPSDWGNSIKTYIYNEESGSVKTLAPWPGVEMSCIGNDLYRYVLENWDGNAYVIFTDGSKQTPGSGQKGYLLKNEESMIYENGSWSSYIE